MYFHEKCCKDFVATKRMLELFNSKNLYSQNAKENLDDNSQPYRVIDQDEEDLF